MSFAARSSRRFPGDGEAKRMRSPKPCFISVPRARQRYREEQSHRMAIAYAFTTPARRHSLRPAASGDGRIKPAGTAEAVEERSEPAPGDAHRHADHLLEQRGLAEVAEVDRVESCIADQLLGYLAGFRVGSE